VCDTPVAGGETTRDLQKGFIAVAQRVWKAAAEENKSSLMSRLRGREGEQLTGKRDWDFTIAFPEQVDFGSGELPLPPSMLEAGAAASVVYELEVRVKRSSLAAKDVYVRHRLYGEECVLILLQAEHETCLGTAEKAGTLPSSAAGSLPARCRTTDIPRRRSDWLVQTYSGDCTRTALRHTGRLCLMCALPR
jgi:hypothetical protein